MGKFQFADTSLKGVKIITPTVFEDQRGFFMETYHRNDFLSAGINCDFVQDNHSKSVKNVLRGLHYQINFPQSKLVRCIKGEVLDVMVDIRKNSPTFGQWESVVLSDKNHKQLFIPKGFAHGFFTISYEAELLYKVDTHYHPNDEGGIIWNDETLNIDWCIPKGVTPILSEKDQKHPTFKSLC